MLSQVCLQEEEAKQRVQEESRMNEQVSLAPQLNWARDDLGQRIVLKQIIGLVVLIDGA